MILTITPLPMTAQQKAFLLFFWRFFLHNLLFTFAAFYLYFLLPSFEQYSEVFVTKIIGYPFICYIFYKYHRKEFYFYLNLGISIKRLLLLSILTDFLIFIPLFLLTIHFYGA